MAQSERAPSLEDLLVRRDEILRIAAARGAHNVRVFGSVARGQARADSDVDLLVELDADRGVLDLSELILDLEGALGFRVDVVETRRSSTLSRAIEREAIAL